MYKKALTILAISIISHTNAQDPTITSWLVNTTGITGRHYIEGSETPIEDEYPANVQTVSYSSNYVYVESSGIPSYIIGPYLDGNPAQGTDNEWIFQISRNPEENTGVLTSTPFSAIGVFINGVPMYDYKDGASYSSDSGTDDMMGGDGIWNRNAIEAEKDGFDCAKGHPSPIFSGGPGPGGELLGGSYHHHQNPTAFNLDLVEVSDVCDLYLADGLYVINATEHAPLLGYAWDGFPVYGAYGYSNPDGTGEIVRIETSYAKRDITLRTTYADGTDVTDGPPVSEEFPLGWYREDFEYVAGSGHLDEHNGRFCITPEYPEGTYAYFATVDENWNSAYPYIVGPQYYGVVDGGSIDEITEDVTVHESAGFQKNANLKFDLNVFPNPATDIIAVQIIDLVLQDIKIELYDASGKLVRETTLVQGSTIWHIDAKTLYGGTYILKATIGEALIEKKVLVVK